MSKQYKTTKKDFEIFKAECRKWVGYFGLLDWEFSFCHRFSGNDDTVRGSCYASHAGRVATLYFAPKWDYKPDESEIRRVAFHEVCEVLTAPLCVMAESRYVMPDEVEAANHYIIRVLENTIFEGKSV